VLAFEAILAGRELGTRGDELFDDLAQQIPREVPRAAGVAS